MLNALVDFEIYQFLKNQFFLWHDRLSSFAARSSKNKFNAYISQCIESSTPQINRLDLEIELCESQLSAVHKAFGGRDTNYKRSMFSIMHSQQLFRNFAVQTVGKACCRLSVTHCPRPASWHMPNAMLVYHLRAASIVSDASDDKKAATSIQYNALSGVNMAAQFIHCNIDYEALELETRYPHDSHRHTGTHTIYI